MALPVALQAQFTYTSDNGLLTITGYTGTNTAVTIPDVIDSQPVNIIGTWAFAYNTGLTSVTVPNSATAIEEWAFYGCTLFSVGIGNNVTNIDNNAFYSCTNLVSVTMGNSVRIIGNSTFAGCTNLGSITIPASVTSIGNSAFAGCTALTNVYFLGNTPTIGSSVFNGDTNATVYHIPGTTGWTLSFGNRPTALGNPLAPQSQFNYTTNSGAITISRYIGADGAVTIPEKINNLPVTSIGIGAFAYNAGLVSIKIPNSVTNISDWAFYSCAHLTTVTMGNGVVRMGESAFNRCVGLKSFYFHGSPPVLGPSVFVGVKGAMVNYMPEATGWGDTFGGFPTQLWNPVLLSRDGNVGVVNNQFGFNIIGNSNLVVVVEACTNLANATWSVAGTTTLDGSTFHFIDPLWDNYPARIYRLRTP